MVLRRCAWHRRYFGYPAVCGIAGWGGRGVDFSDWICRRCAARVRRHLGHRPSRDGELPPALRWDPFLVLPPAAATLLVAVMMLIVTSPHEHFSPVITPPSRPAPPALRALVPTPAAAAQPGRSLTTAPPLAARLASADPGTLPAQSPPPSLEYGPDFSAPSRGPSSQAP